MTPDSFAGPAAAEEQQAMPAPLEEVLSAAGAAAYRWLIATDEISWSANAADILGCEPARIASGKAYAALLDSDNFTSRYDTVMRSQAIDDGVGVMFRIEYKLMPDGRGTPGVWVEDHGTWFAGIEGRPAEVRGTVRRIDERHRHDQHLLFLGNCDPLTGMMNRGRMAEALGEAIEVAKHEEGACAFMIAAINNLGVVNEAYGFEVADEVVVAIARKLRDVVRGGDAIARYSGAKFGLILNQCSDDDIAIAAERFMNVAREGVIDTSHGPVWVLLSIGGIVLPKHAQDVNSAIARAEEALTEARRLPSDGYVIYRPSYERSSQRKLNAHSATEIVHCLKDDRFRLAFQPVVSAAGQPVFHEALLRMTDTGGEVIAAAHLIPIAEKLGLVRLIDRTVVQMSIATLQQYPAARLSLNLSGTTATDPRWYPEITRLLSANRNVTSRLIIEITETVALSDLSETKRFVEELRALGCSVAIDDFGAGYTSFRHLRQLPVNILKLDGEFCRDLANNPDNQYFVRSLIDMAKSFGLETVAEWVETEEDADLLKGWGADFLQGNFYAEASLEPPWPKGQAAAPAPAETEAAPKAPAAEPASPMEPFEDRISSEIGKLRAAIQTLDGAFHRKPSEPESADPVSGERQAG